MKQLREGVILGSPFADTVLCSGEGPLQELEAAGHIASAVRAERDECRVQFTFSFYSVWDPRP